MTSPGDSGFIEPEDVLAAVGQALIVTGLDGTVVQWNKAAEELYGWTSEEAVGSQINELCVPDMAQERAADVMAALRDGVPWSGSFPVRRKDGSLFTALVTDSGIYRGGEMVGIVGLSTNLGSALQPLLERSTDAAIVLRSDAVIVFASNAVEQLFGWKVDDLVGSSVVPLLHPDDVAGLADVLERVVATPGAHPPMDVRVWTERSWTWAEVALTNFLDDPDVRGVVCNLRPSLRRAAQEEAEIRAAQLQTALDTRVVIEQAKGFLAARDGLEPEEAFSVLRNRARSHHRSLHDEARRAMTQPRQES
ncbi:MAG: PAS domain S-box protein [Nocardioides sp.]